VQENTAPVGEVTIDPNRTESKPDTRTAEQRVLAGESPTGEPPNQWIGGEAGGARYIWIRGADNSLTQVIDAGNGYVYETRYSSTTGQPEFSRYFDPNSQSFKVAYDRRPVTNAEAGPDNYVVQDGDKGISYLAERLGVSSEDIVRANPWLALNPDRVAVGQVINVPGLGVQRELETQTGLMGEAILGGTAGVTTGAAPSASTPRQESPAPRLDENGMPLPELREGAAYDPNTDPVYKLLLDTIREAQQSDLSIPSDAPRYAALNTGTTTRTDAGPEPTSSAEGITPPPEIPATLGNNFGEGAIADPLVAPNHSFNTPNTPPTEQSWYSGENATANSYAQGVQSAVSFIQALQQGNEFSATLSGMSMMNAFGRASGVTQANLPFHQTTTAGLGAVSASLNLYDALKADDNLGALVAGSNLSVQVAHWASASTAFETATRSAAGNFADTMGPVVGALSVVNSLKHGDELGAAIGAIMMVNPVLGIGLSIARALFGGDDPPEPRGTAEAQWNADGSLRVAVTEDDDGGGKSAQGMMQSMVDTLNGYLNQQTDAHGVPSFALIPQRLPTVSFFQREYAEFILNYTDEHGQPITRHYNGQGQRIGLDGSVESTVAEDFLDEVMGQNAIVPKWEADTVRQRMEHGDPEAWKDETLPTPEDVKGGLMALTFHIPGTSSEGAGTSARFDLNNDGYLDPFDWSGPYQAFLALDRDGNGIIDSGRELLTTQASASHRTASLEWLDANGDGVLNSNDPAFSVLKLWLDVNSNAHTEEGELATMSQLGITAIDFTQNPPVIVDGEGNTQPLTPKHLLPKGEGARINTNEGGTQIELQDGYRAFYLRAGDTRLQSVPPSSSVQEELARHTSNMSREAQGLFGGNAALLTGLAVAQTAAAGNVPATPLTLADVEHAIAAAQSARTLGSDTRSLHGLNATPTPTLPHEGGGDRASSATLLPSPSFPLPEGEGGEPILATLVPVHSGAPDHPLDTGTTTGAPAFTNPLTTGEIIAGAEDTALILTQDALLANDFSRNSNAQLRISAVGNASRGTVSLLDTGEVVFTPELNYFGPASFTYTVSDQWGYASQALATVNLASVNDAPVIEAVEFGRPIFGYQSVTVRNYSVDWQPGWAYDPNTGQYYQDVPTLQAVNNDATAQGLLATNQLLDGGGTVLIPTYYQSGQLRPIAFDAIDATQAVDDGNGNITYAPIDDDDRMQGRVISYDIDGDSTAITYSLGGSPAHGHAAVGWMVAADAPADLPPDQLGNYAQYSYGAWQYASQPGDGYTGTDPFQVAATDGDGGVTMAAVDGWHHGTNQGGGGKKPVALDLDGNGLDFVGLDDSNVYFDVNGDGWREHIAWTGQNDGLLVLDTEGDRVIDKPEEISFAQYLMGAITDLEGLNAFDDNDDGLLSKLDARFNDFAVWQDQNLNGLSEEGEVTTLTERGIESINLTSDRIPQTLEGGDVQLFGTGTYTTTDGETHQLGDAAFRYTNETVPPAGATPTPAEAAIVTEADIMRMALVFTEMSAAFGAGTANEPLGSIDTAVTDPAIVTYDDPTGLVPGKT
jgi:hypothetical protein